MKQVLKEPKTIILKKSKLERERFDPYYYEPKYLNFLKLLAKLKIRSLKDISTVVCGPFGSAIKVSDYMDKGIPLIRVGNIKDGEIKETEETNIVFISPSLSNKLKTTQVHPNDLVISQRGTLGIVAKVPTTYETWHISANIIGIKNVKDVSPDYLLAFLNSKLGSLQLKRKISGQVQGKIITADIKSIKIPIPSKEIQNKITKIMQEAYENKKENLKKADKMLGGIDNFILNELGIKLPKIEEKKVFGIKKSELEQRFDAGFYKEKYAAIVHSLTEGEKRGKYKLMKFGEISDYFKKGIEVGSKAYIGEGILFIRVENIQDYKLSITENSKFISKECYQQLRNFEPKVGEILLTKDGTIGRAFLVENEIGGITSSGILRIGIKKGVSPYYICGLLNSKFIRTILERHVIGTVIKHLSPEIIKGTLLPIPSFQIQDKIAKEVKQRKEEAERLIQETGETVKKAKLKVEKLIEGR